MYVQLCIFITHLKEENLPERKFSMSNQRKYLHIRYCGDAEHNCHLFMVKDMWTLHFFFVLQEDKLSCLVSIKRGEMRKSSMFRKNLWHKMIIVETPYLHYCILQMSLFWGFFIASILFDANIRFYFNAKVWLQWMLLEWFQ